MPPGSCSTAPPANSTMTASHCKPASNLASTAQSELSNNGGWSPGDAKKARVKSAAPFGAKEVLAPSCVSWRDRQRRVCRRPAANGRPRMGDLDGTFQEATSGLTGGQAPGQAGRPRRLFIPINRVRPLLDWVERALYARLASSDRESFWKTRPSRHRQKERVSISFCCPLLLPLRHSYGAPASLAALRNIKHDG